MKRFIASLMMAAFCVATIPAKPAEAGGYQTGGGYYVGQRHAVPPPQYRPLPPPMPREPHVYGWGRQFYAPQPQRCCHVWTTHGWVTVPGPCPTFRAYNGTVRQRPGYPY